MTKFIQKHKELLMFRPPGWDQRILPLSCSLTGRLPPRRLSHPGTGGPEVADWWPRGGELVAQSAQSCSASAQSCSEDVKRCENLYRNIRNSLCFRPPGSDTHILPLSCSLHGRLPPRRLSHPGTSGPELASGWPRGRSTLPRIGSKCSRKS